MIVRCETCHSQFSLDEHGLGPDGTSVRCSVCASVFSVVPPQPWNLEQQAWQIRTRSNDLYVVRDFKVLRRWLTEGRVGPDDEISRTGQQWTRLGDMPEWEPYWRADVRGSGTARPSVITLTDREWSIYQQAQHATARGQAPVFRPPADAPIAAAASNSGWATASASSTARAMEPEMSPTLARSLAESTVYPVESPANDTDDQAIDDDTADESPLGFDPTRPLDLERDAPIQRLHPPRRGRTWLWLGGLAAAGVGAWLGMAPRNQPLVVAESAAVAAAAPVVPPPPSVDDGRRELEHRLIEAQREIASCDVPRLERALETLRELSAAADSSPMRTRARAATAQAIALRALLWRLVGVVDPEQTKNAVASQQRDRAEFIRIYTWVDQDRPSADELRRVQLFGDLLQAKVPTFAVPDDLQPLLILADLTTKPRDGAALLARVPARSISEDPLAQALQAALHYTLADAAGQDIDAWLRAQPDAHLVAAALRKVRAARLAVVAPSAPSAANQPTAESHDSLVEKGCGLVGRGDASGGLAILLRAFDSAPDDAEVLLCMGQAHARLRQHARALALFEKVLQRTPSHRVALYGASTSAAAQGDDERARGYFSRLLVVDPTNAAARAFMQSHSAKEELPSVTPESRAKSSDRASPAGG